MFKFLRKKTPSSETQIETPVSPTLPDALAHGSAMVEAVPSLPIEEVTSPIALADVQTDAEAALSPPPSSGLFARMRASLSKTRQKFTDQVATLVLGKKVIDQALLDELETVLLNADLGVQATAAILADLTRSIARQELSDPAALLQALRSSLIALLKPCERPLLTQDSKPFVFLMIGVNGAGKTTTIGKLAYHLKQQGNNVMLAAGDTFRAAAVEQLQSWGARNQIPVIAQQTGADSASVLFDAVKAAKARHVDILLADTAGRLHNKDHLMEELKKIKRVLHKAEANAPHEVCLVLDAGIGQNGINQAEQFHQALGVTSLILTKLDGTAKGGVIFSIAEKFKLPIYFVGIGEQPEDLRVFNAEEFVDSLLPLTGQ